MNDINLKQGNCKEVLCNLDDESIHSVVTDPPYELGFLNKEWDSSGIAFDQDMWKEVFRVLKPGGHLLSFGGNRTHHRMMVAVEDAGFIIKNTLMWIYANGMPKSTDVSKKIDKHHGVEDERDVVGTYTKTESHSKEYSGESRGDDPWGRVEIEVTEPASEDGKKWKGWGTNVKPAYEPVVLARKPKSEKNFARNVLKHGVGALNIDGCRISTTDDTERSFGDREDSRYKDAGGFFGSEKREGKTGGHPGGRWPANLILDERASVMLDKQSGDTSSSRIGNPNSPKRGGNSNPVWGMSDGRETHDYRDEGGASRFFYSPKAQRDEKDIGGVSNDHETVKPIELMAYLVRLVTPENGTVLDPFMGSGSTGVASVLEEKDFVGIELSEKNFELSRERIEYTKNNFQQIRDLIFDDPHNEITEKEKSTINHDFWEQ